MLLISLQFFAALTLLFFGGSLLVRATSALALLLKTKVFFISLFLLGMGSSAPELFVSIESHLNLKPDIAVGNIVGSNIFNILIVGALVILSSTWVKNQKTMIKSTTLLLGATLATTLLVWDLSLSRIDGLILLGLFTLFFIQSRGLSEETPSEGRAYSLPVLAALIVVGFAFLFLGSRWAISSAVEIGNHLGLSTRIIGLFLMSVGTSLPELAIGIAALFKKESEIALGGIIGSNAFNTFLIPGIASLIFALPVSPLFLKTDGIVMIFSTLLLLVFLLIYKKVPKALISSLFFTSYILYVYFVLLHRI